MPKPSPQHAEVRKAQVTTACIFAWPLGRGGSRTYIVAVGELGGRGMRIL
jgi:hypothetical protein